RAHSLTQTSPFPRVHDSPIRNIPTNPRIVIDHQIFESSRRAEDAEGTRRNFSLQTEIGARARRRKFFFAAIKLPRALVV
ncbi:MAG: hypothetical protein ACLQNE_30850, partial [Thermoguttaceae bacterium]